MGGRPAAVPPKNIQGRDEANPPYPSQEDYEFAKKNEAAYGTTYERAFNNLEARVMGREVTIGKGKNATLQFQPTGPKLPATPDDIVHQALAPEASRFLELSKNPVVQKEMEGVFGRAALAAQRDPIATLGFDPNHVVMDVVNHRLDLRGATDPNDKNVGMYVNKVSDSGSTVVHESIHRGLELLEKRRYEDMKKIVAGSKATSEDITRWLMHSVMGRAEVDPQTGEHVHPSQMDRAKMIFSNERNQRMLKELQDLAADEIARKRPGGPR